MVAELRAKVEDVKDSNFWRQIQTQILANFKPWSSKPYRIIWKPGPNGKFSIANATLQSISWLAIKNKLLTKSHFYSKGLREELSCVLCRGNAENLDHLFSSCSFSHRI